MCLGYCVVNRMGLAHRGDSRQACGHHVTTILASRFPSNIPEIQQLFVGRLNSAAAMSKN